MPGRDSYGPGGKWIHDRAHHIMSKNPSMAKGIAYAVATQQAHKVGKSPKSFRTAEGVRVAKEKHYFPKKLYKKTASDKRKIAMARLRELIKEATIGRRVAKFRSTPRTYRAHTVHGAASSRPAAPKYELHVPEGMKAKRRGRIEKAFFGGDPMKAVPTLKTRAKGLAGKIADRAGAEVAGRLRAAALAKPVRAMPAQVAPVPTPSVPKSISPRGRKALKGAGLATLGLTGGALGHQLAYASGASQTGPADVVANMLVPTEQ